MAAAYIHRENNGLELTALLIRDRGHHGMYIGVMAHDVLKVELSAVNLGNDLFYPVNYQELSIEMLQIRQLFGD